MRSQEIPRIKGKFALGVQNEEGQRLTEFCQENALVIGKHHQMVNTKIRLIIFFAAKDREALHSQQKTRSGADCGSDHELFSDKFIFKLKKVGKTTRPFRYDPNQIPYDYTVEVRNTFKGLNLIECLKNYGWRFETLYRRQGSRPHPREKKMQKLKMAV